MRISSVRSNTKINKINNTLCDCDHCLDIASHRMEADGWVFTLCDLCLMKLKEKNRR